MYKNRHEPLMAVLPFCRSVVRWSYIGRAGCGEGSTAWRAGNRAAGIADAPGERTVEWTTERAVRASGRSVSRAPASHGDVDEGGPQLLVLVNAASATSSHGQVPQTGWGSVQEEAQVLNLALR